MADTQETIADIIAEMRTKAECAKPYDDGIVMMLTDYADRLEAAWKREKATAENSSAVGNMAAMREALQKIKELFSDTDLPIGSRENEAYAIAEVSLATPARNCDGFATLEDARKEHHKICEEYGACNKACGYKSGHSGTYQCFERWLFLPMMAKKGESNEQK